MSRLILERECGTGCFERHYSVGTLNCFAFRMGSAPTGLGPQRLWAGAIYEGEMLSLLKTKALRASGVIDELVTWSEKLLLGPLGFGFKERDLNEILRRIEVWSHQVFP